MTFFFSCQKEETTNKNINASLEGKLSLDSQNVDTAQQRLPCCITATFKNLKSVNVGTRDGCEYNLNTLCVKTRKPRTGAVIYYISNPDTGGGDIDIDISNEQYTSLVRFDVLDDTVIMEILEYSDDEMYDENNGVFTLEEDGYLKFENPIYGLPNEILLRAGEYEIMPSDSENSVGVVHISAEVHY